MDRYGHLLSAPGERGAVSSRAGQQPAGGRRGDWCRWLLAIPAAFGFSRYPGRDGWLYAGLGILYGRRPWPCAAPLYFILEHFGLLNTRSGLVLSLLLADGRF
ncbi:hypothetical protein LNP25_28120 [Klebsiella variicola subsp. variicola]|nr:hypothetical protein [Klebsiella variicola subsp. variicola]